jgi:DNA (cytosine-5)-methyltransferase 1
MMTFGSLFTGVGGMDIGLERAGMVCKWQVEIDSYARRVLARHWPNVRRHDDVRTFPPKGKLKGIIDLRGWVVDVVCGGFPCQDISVAGRGKGIDGERSGLWREFHRIIRILRPGFVLVENSPALLGRGLGSVLRDLASIGYDAEWDCFPCAAFGAIHIRNRLFLLAYPNGQFGDRRKQHREMGRVGCAEGSQEKDRSIAGDDDVHDSYRRRYGTPQETIFAGRGGIELSDWWSSEPGVGRVAHGVPNGVDRRRCLGNAVVPQVVEWIGRRIMEAV